jgi:hypothetical protein
MRKTLNFKPWIGENCLETSGNLMILGESHYDDIDGIKAKPERPDFTINVVEDIFSKSFISNTSKNIHKLLLGENSEESWKEIYDNVIFFELIQEIMEKKNPGFQTPSKQQYLEGWGITFDQVEKLKVENIIALGTSGYRPLMKFLQGSDVEVINNSKEEKISNCIPRVITVRIKDQEVVIYFIKHPGSYFSFNKWRKFLKSKNDSLLLR